MAATAVENPPAPVTGESKSARKKKGKAEAGPGLNGPDVATPVESPTAAKDGSAGLDADANSEHAYLREIAKQIRNINKKLTGFQKTDTIIKENPGVSLDDLVAQRKINADQKASALKKPQLQAQLAQLEEQAEQYRKFDADYQQRFTQQREELAATHQTELEKARTEARLEAQGTTTSELRQKLLTFSQFLRAAAHKRTIEEEADTEESKAFEGALLLVYGGDQKAVDTAISLIDGSDASVPNIEGVSLPVTFAQVKKASLDHAPFQSEEAWVDQVAEATGGGVHAPSGSDPTIANAGLTELDTFAQTNGASGHGTTDSTFPTSAGDAAGNTAGERWDTKGGAESGRLEDSYEVIPRPSEEVDIPVDGAAATSTNWADDAPPAYSGGPTGNKAGESWDTKAAGDQTDSKWDATPTQTGTSTTQSLGDPAAVAVPADDGFHEVSGRHRGRGGRGRGHGEVRGEFRGHNGTRRGNFRDRGAGHRGRGDGEHRGRGGRGGRGGHGGGRGGQGSGNAAPPS